MPRLGLEVSKDAIDALFNSWDPDGSGELNFKELQRILRGGGPRKQKEIDKNMNKGFGTVKAASRLGRGASIFQPGPKIDP